MDGSLLFFIIPFFYFVSYVILFWVFVDARDKHGTNIGCLWALIVLATGPLGLIAYLVVRNMD
ncbi:hypothetical protein FIU87_03030 [Bacillus sp. THAF10]|uniref:hypothetical protein n=1 Tax=Bacillus sp. THAF10 TaxID=2587848 RepID=UPI0012679476|nr:hypothetical protein [Bacillus sp. THAF10]QFT87614.1 hypothetical protein FIU87_03030 [Bacillus sp. THAF10]